jgi:NitT/TauT family transport system ATP-binding protein
MLFLQFERPGMTGRALVNEPQVLMLDEPFCALDQFSREVLWSVMHDLWLSRRPTVVRRSG